MRALTRRQQTVLEYIQTSIRQNGYPPTLREIGSHFGIRSTNGVNDHLRALERKGFLTRQDMKSRALRPTGMTGGEVRDVPLVGRVAAGTPLMAMENIEASLRIDASLLPDDAARCFALRVRGDSMIEAGIHDGDVVFVRQQDDAPSGSIVVALIGDEATVKRLYRDAGHVRLQPANQAMAPILVANGDAASVRILGVVIGVYRRIH